MTIVEELRQNPESGSKRLEAEYKAGLMTLARRFCADESDAAELVNRTFSAVVEGIDDYLEQSAFFAWMCQILTNIHSMDVRRKSNRTIVYPGDVPDTTDEKATTRIEEEVDASLLRDAVQRLPADQRELLLLHYFMDMPVAKIAKFLSIPQGTVMSRLHYARKALAAKLGMAAKRPGVRTLLIALALAALTAVGAAVVIAVGDARNTPPALSEGTPLSEGGGTYEQPPSERGVAQSAGGSTAIDDQPQSATDTSTPPPTHSSTHPLPPTTGDIMNRTTAKNTASALLAATTLAVASGTANLRAATTYSWLASPADANWNTTSLNWTTDGTDAVAWTNNADDPNSAVFGDSSKKSLTLGGRRRVGNLTLNKGGYSFSGSSGVLTIYDAITANGNTTFGVKIESGAADGSLRLTSTTSTSSSDVTVNFNSSQNSFTSIYLNGTFVFVPILDGALGPKPATRTENIVVTDGSPTLFGGTYNNKSFTVNSNRIVKIASGKSLKLASNYTFTLGGPVIAEPTSGYDYSRNTYVQVRGKSGWEGLIVFAPGAGVTNAFGRLDVAGRGKVASGVTRVTGAGGTGSSAILYVHGSGSFSDTLGNLLIDGGELYASQQVNVDISTYGQVTVTNFGKVYMPKVDWLNGSSGRAKLTVAKDGAFTVNLLRISQSSSLSEVHLNEGGLIEASLLCIDPAGKRNGKFRFNGGRLRSREAKNPFFASTGGTSLAEDKAAYVTFAVGEKGAVFDTELKNLYWNRPLVSDPEGTDTDGGLHKIGGNILILTSTNCYNGITWIEGNDAQLRVDNALPPGTTLRLSNGGFITAYTFEKETPQRSTEQWIGRVEGSGALKYMTQSHVTNAIAPSVDGTIKFESRCDLRGDFEVSGNAAGCSRLQVAAGQDISGLTLKVEDFSTFNGKASREHYQILSAPDGYTGTFALPAGWADDWKVIYTDTGAYLWAKRPLIIVIR